MLAAFKPLARKCVARPIRFGVAGAVSTAVHWSVMAALILLGGDAAWATGAGAVAGAAANYPLQRKYAFTSRCAHHYALPRYLAVCAIAWIANLACFGFLQSALDQSVIVSQALTTAVVAVLSYVLYSTKVFHEP